MTENLGCDQEKGHHGKTYDLIGKLSSGKLIGKKKAQVNFKLEISPVLGWTWESLICSILFWSKPIQQFKLEARWGETTEDLQVFFSNQL